MKRYAVFNADGNGRSIDFHGDDEARRWYDEHRRWILSPDSHLHGAQLVENRWVQMGVAVKLAMYWRGARFFERPYLSLSRRTGLYFSWWIFFLEIAPRRDYIRGRVIADHCADWCGDG